MTSTTPASTAGRSSSCVSLLAKIQRARTAKEASTVPLRPRLRREAFERRLLVSVFTDEEREYLASGVPLGRLATVGSDGTPQVVPTGFRYNPDTDTIDVGGHDFATRKKYRDVLRHPKVAFVIDDLVSVSPLACPGHRGTRRGGRPGHRRQRAGAGLCARDVQDHAQPHRELGPERGTDVVQREIRPLTTGSEERPSRARHR
jgi:PPOX class F420-dependent enzyme/OxyR family protein